MASSVGSPGYTFFLQAETNKNIKRSTSHGMSEDIQTALCKRKGWRTAGEEEMLQGSRLCSLDSSPFAKFDGS